MGAISTMLHLISHSSMYECIILSMVSCWGDREREERLCSLSVRIALGSHSQGLCGVVWCVWVWVEEDMLTKEDNN